MSQCAVPVLDRYYLGLTAIITVVQQGLFFIIAAGFKFDKVCERLPVPARLAQLH
jgi:hypothetical protein